MIHNVWLYVDKETPENTDVFGSLTKLVETVNPIINGKKLNYFQVRRKVNNEMYDDKHITIKKTTVKRSKQKS